MAISIARGDVVEVDPDPNVCFVESGNYRDNFISP